MPQLPPVAAAAFVLSLLVAVAITTVIVRMRSRRRSLLLAAMVRDSAPIPRPTISTVDMPMEAEVLPLRGRNYQRAEREARFEPFDDRPATREGAPGRPGRRLAAQVAHAAPAATQPPSLAPSVPPAGVAPLEVARAVFPLVGPEVAPERPQAASADAPARAVAAPPIVPPAGPAPIDAPTPSDAAAPAAPEAEAPEAPAVEAAARVAEEPEAGAPAPVTPVVVATTASLTHAGLESVLAFEVSQAEAPAEAVGALQADQAAGAVLAPADEAEPGQGDSFVIAPRPPEAAAAPATDAPEAEAIATPDFYEPPQEEAPAIAASESPPEQEVEAVRTGFRSDERHGPLRQVPEVVVIARRPSLPVPAVTPLLTREVSLGDAARVLRGLTMTDGRQLRRAVAVGAATSVVAAAFAIRGRRRG